jgi:arylsulfate sulfotransferase
MGVFAMNPRRLALVFAVCALSAFTTLAQAQTNASTTVLTATPSTISPGQTVALTVAVQVASGDPAPTGTVQIFLGSYSVSSLTLTNGTAEYTAPSTGVAPGTYALVANYSGDANTMASQSSQVPVTIVPYATTTALALTPASVFNQQVATATATVIAAQGQKPLTGTVTFSLGATSLGTVPLVKGSATVHGNSAKLPDGAYQISATYNGDAYHGASSSGPEQLTVFGDTTTAFTITPSVVEIGAKATFAVAVTGDSGISAGGTVSFYFGSTLLGQAPVVDGAATLSKSSAGVSPGTYAVTAKYSGDAKNDPSSASTIVHAQGTTNAYAISPAGAALATGAAVQFAIAPTDGSAITWYVNGAAGGSSATGTIDANGNYASPSGLGPLAVEITASQASNPYAFAVAVPVYVVVPGSVGASNSPQVAKYSIQVPQGGQMSVEFGPDTTYGLNTWQQPTPVGGGTQTMLVAGMMAPATYHMRADVDFGNGLVYQDTDHAFAVNYVFTPPANTVVTQGAGMTPQPGIEIANTIGERLYGYDVNGNMIWGLAFPATITSPSIYQPVKLMANGHLLVQISPQSDFPVDGGIIPSGTTIGLFEILLDGTIVRELSVAQLNANLAASGYLDGQGNLPTLLDMHHEVTINPVTGHWLVLANTTRTEPETNGPEAVLGDVVLDVDPNNNYAIGWVWNSFDHLDVTRHPQSVQDWTHTNALVYSQTDHQLLISMRYQNWILKVDYNDGAGTGDVIWHFGYQGDFTLVNGTSPQDWQFGQHEPSFTTPNTTGVFGLTMMDNGLERIFSAGYNCQNGTAKPCSYSRVPQFTVDETAMTATLGPVMPYENYSYFGGNGEILPNGDSHADFCSVVDAGDSLAHGVVEEYTGGDNPQFVWSLNSGGTVSIYRSHRWGSLYPGVTWASAVTPQRAKLPTAAPKE